jgi:hypothetical protein
MREVSPYRDDKNLSSIYSTLFIFGLVILLKSKKGDAGDISTSGWVQIQPGFILDREVNENRPNYFARNKLGLLEALKTSIKKVKCE